MCEIDIKEESILKEVLSILDCEIKSADNPAFLKNINKENDRNFYKLNKFQSDFDINYEKYFSSKRIQNKEAKETFSESDCMQHEAENSHSNSEPESLHDDHKPESVPAQHDFENMPVQPDAESIDHAPESMPAQHEFESMPIQSDAESIDHAPEFIPVQDEFEDMPVLHKAESINHDPESVPAQNESEDMPALHRAQRMFLQHEEQNTIIDIKQDPESIFVQYETDLPLSYLNTEIHFEGVEDNELDNLVSCDFMEQSTYSVYKEHSYCTFKIDKTQIRKNCRAPGEGPFKFTEDQRAVLEKAYQSKEYLDLKDRRKLASQLGISRVRVDSWIFRRRYIGLDASVRRSFSFTKEQQNVLERAYKMKKNMNKKEQEKLAQNIGVYSFYVHNWFYNRRRNGDGNENVSELKDYMIQRMRHTSDESVPRRDFSDEQKQILEMSYHTNNYPSTEDRKKLARELGMSVRRIRNWFTDRRRKDAAAGMGNEATSDCTLLSEAESNYTSLNEAECDSVSIYETASRCIPINDAANNSLSLSTRQTMILETFFENQSNPNMRIKQKLADTLGLSFNRVHKWFHDKLLENNTERRNCSNEHFKLWAMKLTNEQKQALEMSYNNGSFRYLKTKVNLAQKLGLTVGKIQRWFRERNRKFRQSEFISLLTEEQEEVLEMSYSENMFPDQNLKEGLAQDLKVPVKKIQNWFLARRKKHKRMLARKSECTGYSDQLNEEEDTVDMSMVEEEKCGSQNNVPDLEEQNVVSNIVKTEADDNTCLSQFNIGQNTAVHTTSGSVYTRKNLARERKLYLEEVYTLVQFPDKEIISDLARNLKVSRKSLSNWFSHKRRKGDPLKYYDPLTEEHVQILEAFYMNENYPHGNDKQSLAEDLGVSVKIIHQWFINRLLHDNKDVAQVPKKFTEEEREFMEICYQVNKFPNKEEKAQIARKLGVNDQKITKWFIFRRHKDNSFSVNLKSTSMKEAKILEGIYKRCKVPNIITLSKLEKRLKKPISEIRTWFFYRRKMEKLGSPKRNPHLTEEQISILESSCKNDVIPSQKTQNSLAQKLGLPRYRVKKWFRDMRPLTKSESFCSTEEQKPTVPFCYVEVPMGDFDNGAFEESVKQDIFQ